MTNSVRQDRECVIEMALTAQTLPTILEAEHALRAYMAAHPEDRNIADVAEPLALRRMGLEEDSLQPAEHAA